MRPINATVTKTQWGLTEGQQVKIIGFSSQSYDGGAYHEGGAAPTCVIVLENGEVCSARPFQLKVDYQTI